MTYAFFLLWALTGFLSFFIGTRLEGGAASGFENALSRVLGSAKEAVGDTLFLKADSYYHGGVERKFEETAEDLEKEGPIGADGSQTAHADHADDDAPSDWIAKINGRIRNDEHIHLAKDGQKEMLPFFAMAISLDPHNVEAILTAAYWLDSRFNKIDEAAEVLEQGAKNNPDAWEMDYELANLYFRRRRDYAASKRLYLSALGKSRGRPIGAHARGNLYYFLAESHARLGEKEEALKAYRWALETYPLKETDSLYALISGKIRELLR